MKIAIITDQHFGARKSSRIFHDFFKKFYRNVFFPTLKNVASKQFLTWEIHLTTAET